MLKQTLRWTKRITCGGTLLGGVSCYIAYKKSPGFKRSMDFGALCTPMACAYFGEYCKTRSKDEKVLGMEVLHKKYAPELLNIILRMKGYYVKCA